MKQRNDIGLEPYEIDAADNFRFRNYRVDCRQRRVICGDRSVDLGSRAFDLLTILLKYRGSIVSKKQLLEYVWPRTVVEECNLRYQVASLRKALGEDRDVVKTISGRGYLLLEDVAIEPTANSQVLLDHRSARDRAATASVAEQQDTRLVAIVDDDENIREALKGLLQSTGLRAESFSSVREFSRAFGQSDHGCLILDCWLPDRTGLDFQLDLAQQGSALPVIFISGHADVQMCAQAMKAGAVEFLTKPVRHQALLEAVQLAFTFRTKRYLPRTSPQRVELRLTPPNGIVSSQEYGSRETP